MLCELAPWVAYAWMFETMDPPLAAFVTLWIQRVVAGIWMWRVGAAELHYYRDAKFCTEWGKLFDIQDGVMYLRLLVIKFGVGE